MSRYRAPKEIEELCIAEVISALHQEQSGWSGEVGTGEGQQTMTPGGVARLREETIGRYQRWPVHI
jgi:hypothetical protein